MALTITTTTKTAGQTTSLQLFLAPVRERRPQGYPGIWEKQAPAKEAQDSSICSFTDLGQMPGKKIQLKSCVIICVM